MSKVTRRRKQPRIPAAVFAAALLLTLLTVGAALRIDLRTTTGADVATEEAFEKAALESCAGSANSSAEWARAAGGESSTSMGPTTVSSVSAPSSSSMSSGVRLQTGHFTSL